MIMEHLINKLMRSNIEKGMSEQQYWERFWRELLENFSKHQAPFEEVDKWEKGCNYEMVRHYTSLFGDLKGKTIIEIGCGGGHISGLLAKEAEHVTLVDFSPYALEYAKKTVRFLGVEEKFTFIEGDLFSLPLKPHDICYNCGVLEHYQDKDAILMLQRMADLSTELAAVTIPNLLSPELVYRMLRYGKGSERYMTPGSINRLIRNAELLPGIWLPVNYWSPSFLAASISERARKANLVKLFPGLAWLFTYTFTHTMHT